ncbi:MAG: serine/threonine protein kinase [Zoogloeaceae bacterium]|jgi:hypothetical protein|nr:serine/threonine protein kinase [Zoogloeaceae bacterium]
MKTYVRVCPVCDTENPAERATCSCCASLLSEVDFSLPSARTGESAAAPPPAAKTAKAPEASAPPVSAEGTRCPDPECGQQNPPGSLRCLYCNTPLPVAVAADPAFAPLPDETAAAGTAAAFELAPPELAAAIPAPRERRRSRMVLPAALAERFRIIDELPAAGSEADLLIVEEISGGEQRVAKIYRRGIAPDQALLKKLATAGTHVVRIMEYGNDGDAAWEVMEYCRVGSLRALMKSGPMSRERLTELVRELAAGLTEVHAAHILHRDLKPENVLLRRQSPLSLALTDFGIASLFDGTRHFTDGARTVKYAAPEAMTGVLDAKADWWSLGMILLEAASGRHPFDGLSEQVVNYHLMTRPVEINGVADKGLALLCRGLLLRDPARRFGAAEVARWLAGDVSLVAPQESGVEAEHPYQLGKHTAKNSGELALALAANWQEGAHDLARGLIMNWLKMELHDFDLIRKLSDIMDLRGEPDDRRLLRFLLVAAPDMPPVWRGESASLKALLGKARLAVKTGEAADAARAWLESLFAEDALRLFPADANTDFAVLSARWRQQVDIAQRAWEVAREAYLRWRSRLPSEPGKKNTADVNFDAAVYGWNAEIRPPRRATWHGIVLLSLYDPKFLAALRADVEQALTHFSESAPWFAHLVGKWQAPDAGFTPEKQNALLLAAWRLREATRESMQAEHERRKSAQEKRESAIDVWRQEFLRILQTFYVIGEASNADARQEWRQACSELHGLAARLASMRYTEESFLRLTQHVNSMEYLALQLESALDALDMHEEQARIILRPPRSFWIGCVILLALFFFGGNSGIYYAVAAAITGVIGLVIFHSRRRARAHRKLNIQIQLFRRASAALAPQQVKAAEPQAGDDAPPQARVPPPRAETPPRKRKE